MGCGTDKESGKEIIRFFEGNIHSTHLLMKWIWGTRKRGGKNVFKIFGLHN